MNKQQKTEQIDLVRELAKASNAVYFVDYSGVTVEEISAIRNEFRKEGVKYKVFKNTFVKRIVDELGYGDEAKNSLVGMTGIAFAGENISAPAKVIKAFGEKTPGKFTLKGAVIENQFFGADKLNVLAALPGKKELVASIISSINAPASGIVGAINAVMRDITILISEIEKKKAA